MAALARRGALERELSAAGCIPYTAHVSDTVVTTSYGDYVQVFQLAGASFESADDEQLNAWHERLNILLRNVASPQVALWTHVVRRREHTYPDSGAEEGFAGGLHAKYRARLAGETLMVNELYLSAVYRPTVGAATGFLGRILSRTQRDSSRLEQADALDACEKLGETLQASLARYEPEPLGVYQLEGRQFSRLLEFFSVLITGESQRVPLPRAPLNDVLATTRLCFGVEALEYRLPTRTRVGAMLGIKEYPTPSTVGMFNELLSAPFPFVLSQSFAFLTKAAGQALLQRQFNRMVNAGDFAVSQAEELKDALDALTSNEFVMGDHHFSLHILSDVSVDGPGEPGERRLKALNDHVALARALLADSGMTVAREDLALEAAFWAQLPGNFPLAAPQGTDHLAQLCRDGPIS